MDANMLRVFAERARSLAVIADPYIKVRLTELARRYDERIKRVLSHQASRAHGGLVEPEPSRHRAANKA